MPRVLIVDDSLTVRNIVKGYLLKMEGKEFQILTAVNGEEALAILEKDRVDLILTDFEMPKLDGFSMLQKIKTHPVLSSIPVIVISAMTNAKKREFEELGYPRVVFKPIEEEKLRAYLEEALKV
ncbi:MAG: response regulator [Candidatus Riflebacteria bacterium]|nr:response regulator [Candidatus Riflebacteria bacterium]